jgi:NADH dehydrogenase/NADH:ubiquinone oxidoreductase subunit G
MVRSTCLFCSLGCGVAFKTSGDHIIETDFDRENPINKGSLCPRGFYNIELLNHPKRLTCPSISGKKASWYEALSYSRKKIKEHDPESIAILLSSNSTNEDAYMAAKMAKEIGTNNISAAGTLYDLDAYEGSKLEAKGASLANPEKLGEYDALIIIGDILTRSPVLSKRINQVKYSKRGNHIIVMDPNITHTSWFSTIHLKNNPGTEAILLAGILKVISEENKRGTVDIDLEKVSKLTGVPVETIVRAAKSFDSAESGAIIFVPGGNKERNDLIEYLVRKTSARSMNKNHITFYNYGNVLGVNMVLDSMVSDHLQYSDIVKKIENGKIKALINFGDEDDFSGKHIPFILNARLFDGGKHSVLLPLITQMERKGTVTLAGNRTESLKPLAHKVGGRSALQITALLMDFKTGFDEILEETSKIIQKGQKQIKTDLDEMISKAMKIPHREVSVQEDITHFGNNNLVQNFFWFRVNNG